MKNLNPKIVQHIRNIKITTRRLLDGMLAGGSLSRKKGTGLEFDQIREYQQGDDVRFIDWKSSARMNKLLIKEYCEERNKTIIVGIDCSSSSFFGSSDISKYDVMADIASMLCLGADYNQDQVSVVLFDSEVHKVIPPNKGKRHLNAILQTIYSTETRQAATNLNAFIKHVIQLKRNDAIVFLISDCIEQFDQRYVNLITQYYDFRVIRCLDAQERDIQFDGFIDCEDIETGDHLFIDARKRKRGSLHAVMENRLLEQNRFFNKYGITYLDVRPDESYIYPVLSFLRQTYR